VSTEAWIGLMVLLLITAWVDEVLCASTAIRTRWASAVGLSDDFALENGLWDAAVDTVVWQVLDVHDITDWLLLHWLVQGSFR
jgi:hypothetical protein